MQTYKVILTWEAIFDITDIAEYIEREFGKERADRYQVGMRSQLMNLQVMGSIHSKTSVIYQNYSIYKKLFLPSIIFYIIKEKQKEIHILRVLRSERNWRRILYQQSQYTYPNDIG